MNSRKPWISRNVAAIEISAIKTMAIRGAKVEGAASLTWGLPSFRTPEPIRRAVAEQLDGSDNNGFSFDQALHTPARNGLELIYAAQFDC